MDESQHEIYDHLIKVRVDECNKEQSVLVLCFKGAEATHKINEIVGNIDSKLDTLRGKFGTSIERNCVHSKIFSEQK